MPTLTEADNATPLPILTLGDPALTRVARAVMPADLDDPIIGRLVATLLDFRARVGFGRAIAAPQVGLPLRLVAMELGEGPLLLVNPRITWRSEETFTLWDDCLSVPDRLVLVRRNRSVSVEFFDAAMRPQRWERLPAALSELIQHELDHLDGVLMTERAEPGDAVRPIGERAALVDGPRAAMGR